MLTRAIAALLMLATAPPAIAQERQPGLDAFRRLNLPPDRAGQTARRDLEAMLGPDGDYRFDDNYGRPRVVGQLFTRPVPTVVAGLCSRTMLVIVNEQIEGTATNGHTERIRPTGLETRTQFRVIDAESPFRLWQPTDNSCRDYDPRMGTGWFSAESETVAYRGFKAIRRAAAAVREGRITVTDCDEGSRCAQNVLLAALPENITDIGACEDDREERCYEISSRDYQGYTVTVELSGAYGVEQVARITISRHLLAI